MGGVALRDVFHYPFIRKNNKQFKRLGLLIEDHGYKTWNYNDVYFQYQHLEDLFDFIMMYGDSAHSINPSGLSSMLTQLDWIFKQLQQTAKLDLDFMMIKISLHDRKDEGLLKALITHFPDGLAKEVLYIIDGCYSGQYHQNWENKACLITTSGASEASFPITTSQVEELPNYFPNRQANIEGFIKFYAQYEGSTPHISGLFQEKQLKEQPVKQVADILISNPQTPRLSSFFREKTTGQLNTSCRNSPGA
jgi:hypothetical protein